MRGWLVPARSGSPDVRRVCTGGFRGSRCQTMRACGLRLSFVGGGRSMGRQHSGIWLVGYVTPPCGLSVRGFFGLPVVRA